MKRAAFDLIYKADKIDSCPVIVLAGAVGVGKTSLLTDYIKSNYDSFIYADIENDSDLRLYLSGVDENKPIKQILYKYYGIPYDTGLNIPFVLDNCDSDNRLISCIKNSSEDIGIKLFISVSSFSVFRADGLISVIQLYPLTFDEFLDATGHEWYKNIITGHFENKKKIPDMIHSEILNLFEIYINTGGYPAVINEFIRYDSIAYLSGIKKQIKAGVIKSVCDGCTGNKAGNLSVSLIKEILDAVFITYEKKNRKFMYSTIRKGITEKISSPSVDYLCDTGVLLKQEIYPDKSNGFRLYFCDFGLSKTDSKEFVLSDESDVPFKRALMENYIFQTMLACGIESYYWESGTGAVVDSCIMTQKGIVPLQIKLPGINNSVSSMNFYEKFNSNLLIKINLDNFSFNDNIWNIPIYGISLLSNINK